MYSSKYLKSELLKSELVWNPNFCKFKFPTSLCLKTKLWVRISDMSKPKVWFSFWKKYQKTKLWVWIPNSFWVSEIHTSSDFIHWQYTCWKLLRLLLWPDVGDLWRDNRWCLWRSATGHWARSKREAAPASTKTKTFYYWNQIKKWKNFIVGG